MVYLLMGGARQVGQRGEKPMEAAREVTVQPGSGGNFDKCTL